MKLQSLAVWNQRASSVKIVIFVHLFRAPRIYNYAVPVGTISTLIAMHAIFDSRPRRLFDVADSMAFSSRHASLAYASTRQPCNSFPFENKPKRRAGDHCFEALRSHCQSFQMHKPIKNLQPSTLPLPLPPQFSPRLLPFLSGTTSRPASVTLTFCNLSNKVLSTSSAVAAASA
jgi:hypothetical protein